MSEKQKRKEKPREQRQLIPFLLKLFSIIILVMLVLGFILNQYIISSLDLFGNPSYLAKLQATYDAEDTQTQFVPTLTQRGIDVDATQTAEAISTQAP